MNKRYILIAFIVIAIIAVLTIHKKENVVGALPYSTNFTAIGLGVNDSYVNLSGQRISMTASSFVPCSILSPNATTSLLYATIQLTSTSVSTTTKWLLATAATAGATTTVLYNAAQLAASTGFDYATTSAPTILAPNTYVNVGVNSSSTPLLANVTGFCQAVFAGV